MSAVRLALLGAGLIGTRHAEQAVACPDTTLAMIVDPSPAGRELAGRYGVPWFSGLAEALQGDKPDGVIVATPNRLHVENGLACVAAGIPALIEKPIAESVEAAGRLVEAAETAGVPLLVGHHRRHNPMIRRAKEIIESGRIGRVVAIQATCWFFKPDVYFEPAWRREAGAGPILINLIHDIDNLRFLCGEIDSVQALQSHAVRGFPVEDTAGLLIRFASGAIGTLSVSDTVVSPFSWELTSGENEAYPRTDESCYLLGGAHGTLTVPQLDIWHHSGERSWWEPIARDRVSHSDEDPLSRQVRHFAAVIRGEEAPLVSGREGLRTLRVIEAAKTSAVTGLAVACQDKDGTAQISR